MPPRVALALTRPFSHRVSHTRLPLETSTLPSHTHSLPREERRQVEPGGAEPRGLEAVFVVRQTWNLTLGQGVLNIT